MATEPYDTFEYIQPADFIPALKERYDEQNEGFARAEQMARINDQQRLADAQNFGKVIDNAQKFSVTLAKSLKKIHEKRDQEAENESKILIRESDITWKDLQTYNARNKDKENFIQDTSFYNSKATEYEALYDADPEKNGHYLDLAGQLRSLTGNNARVMKEVLIANHAKGFSNEFLDYRTEDGHLFSVTREDGTPYNIHGARDRGEVRALIREYQKQHHLTKTSGMNDEFLDEQYWPEVERQEQEIVNQWSRNKRAANLVADQESVKEQLTAITPENAGEKYLELVQLYPHIFKDSNPKAGVLNMAFELVEKRLMKEEILHQIMDHKFIPKGSTKETTIGEHFEKQITNGLGMTFDDRIGDMHIKRTEQVDKENQRKDAEFRLEFEKIKADNGGVISEKDFEEAKAAYQQLGIGPLTTGHWLLKEGANTWQDQTDAQIVATLQNKERIGNNITQQEVNFINDPTERDKWSKKVNNGIKNKEQYTNRLDASVDTYFERELADTTKSDDWYKVHYGAQADFPAQFNTLMDSGVYEQTPQGRAQAANAAFEIVKKNIETGAYLVKGSGTDKNESTFIDNRNKATTAIATAVKDKDTDYFSTTIIPGTENALEELKDWTPGKPLPRMYTAIASRTKYVDSQNKIVATAWEIANRQHILQYGKPLRPTKFQQNVTSLKSPYSQILVTHRKTDARVKQAQIIEESNNDEQVFNQEEYVSEFLKGDYSNYYSEAY